jgi:mannose-6-phosphate isomerase-like protein (cupin superfamily)
MTAIMRGQTPWLEKSGLPHPAAAAAPPLGAVPPKRARSYALLERAQRRRPTGSLLDRSDRVVDARKGAAMKGFVADIEKMTEQSSDFRRVLYTGKRLQLVLMSIEPGEEIGQEVHPDRDQFFRVEEGKGEVWIDGHQTKIETGVAILVPAGARHNLKNTGKKALKLYTLYGPPEHVDGTVHVTKADAIKSKEHFVGKTTE